MREERNRSTGRSNVVPWRETSYRDSDKTQTIGKCVILSATRLRNSFISVAVRSSSALRFAPRACLYVCTDESGTKPLAALETISLFCAAQANRFAKFCFTFKSDVLRRRVPVENRTSWRQQTLCDSEFTFTRVSLNFATRFPCD